jgi:hypothetical protein
MFTKMKIAIVLCASLVAGVAGAQGLKPERAKMIEKMKAEHAAKKQEMLTKFDTNKDGKLDVSERTAARDLRLTERFKKLDTDGNGVISMTEFKAGKLAKQPRKIGKHKRGHGMGKGRGLGRGNVSK